MSTVLWTPEQTAERLRLKPKTLARWRWAGQGPCFIKVGGAVRYAEQDIQAFLAAGMRTHATAPAADPVSDDPGALR